MPRRSALLAFVLAAGWLTSAAALPLPYEANYSVYRNGKLIGMLEIALEIEDGRWQIRSRASGTHGLARILRANDREQVTGILKGDDFLPEKHTRHTRMAGIDDHWETNFDWKTDTATVVHDGKETFVLPLQGAALDPLTMKLEMRRRLMENDPDLEFLMVDEDEIDEEYFRLLKSERIETSLGCFETLPIEKIRRNDRRYTRAWHAPELGNLEVRVEHGKVDGNHMELRINELYVNGEAVQPGPRCDALRRSGPMPADNAEEPAPSRR
ncbi:MAG: DUF3108 domain-containing protein [Lysobacterales bacterium]|jgi:hypothetical protein